MTMEDEMFEGPVCQKCKEGYAPSIDTHITYRARLCADCENAFNEYVNSLDIFKEFLLLRSKLYGATYVNDQAGIETLQPKLYVLDRQLYYIAKAWIKGE